MQQRQLRLGDVLDDYCPRERRLTNHAVVAMVGPEVKRTRCVTCDAEHEYKHAKVPRPRRKPAAPPVLYSQVAAAGPKRVVHDVAAGAEPPAAGALPPLKDVTTTVSVSVEAAATASASQVRGSVRVPDRFDAQDDSVSRGLQEAAGDDGNEEDVERGEEGPVHRPLIRATLPRPEGQPPPSRPGPDFTIRQPGGRANRLRPSHPRDGRPFQAKWPGGDAGRPARGGARPSTGRTQVMSRSFRRQGGGHKRSK
jgi:hypothetical protein